MFGSVGQGTVHVRANPTTVLTPLSHYIRHGLPAMLQQRSIVIPLLSRRLRVPPVLRQRLPDALDSFRRPRPGTESTMKPAPSVWHRGTLARSSATILRAAARCLREVARGITVS